MKRRLIENGGGHYVQRHTFRCDELIHDLPEEMLAAKSQLRGSQCYGQFYVEAGMLKCRYYNPANGIPAAYYTWYPFKKTWLL